MKQALEFIITALVDKPEEVVIEEHETNGVIDFQIHVAKEDAGKVIGKEGKIIRSIRNVMKIPAIKENKKVLISLAETA